MSLKFKITISVVSHPFQNRELKVFCISLGIALPVIAFSYPLGGYKTAGIVIKPDPAGHYVY